MSLTKRLYRFDEVRASLLLALRHKVIPEADFWLQELEESQYGSESRRLLFVAWFLFVGLRRISWLVAWSTEGGTREGRRRLCWQLCRCSERDGSLWWLLWCSVYSPEQAHTSRLLGTWTRIRSLESEEECWETIVNQSTDEAIDTCLEALQTDMRAYSLFAKATGVALTVYKHPKASWQPLSTAEPTLEAYDTKAPLRSARTYPIRYTCLFGMTWRGRGGDTTEELKSLGTQGFLSSAFWKKVIAEHTTDGAWKSDEDLEAFWDTHFPWITTDHPDEWSKADREKSHGVGVDCARGAPLWRWWKTWIPDEHRFLWGKSLDLTWKRIQEDRADTSASVLDKILELYRDAPPYVVPEFVKKEWVLCELTTT